MPQFLSGIVEGPLVSCEIKTRAASSNNAILLRWRAGEQGRSADQGKTNNCRRKCWEKSRSARSCRERAVFFTESQAPFGN